MNDRLAKVVGSAFGAGYSPFAPGTVGTLAAVPLFLLLSSWGTAAVLIGLAVCVSVGIPCAGRLERVSGRTDPGIVVIDEVAGYLVTMAGSPADLAHLAAGFLLFRAFDIVKPPPIRILEKRLPGGWGIVVDDLAAGAYSWIALRLVERGGLL